MSAITRDLVAHLASLARIDLTEDELGVLAGELGVILDSVDSIQEVTDADVTPMSHPLPLVNVTREDVVHECLTPAAALAGAPLEEDQRFGVPRILTED